MLQINLNEEQTFSWPVKVDVPEKGRHITKTFTGEFTLLPQDELNTLLGLKAENEEQDLENEDLVDRVLVGWGEDLKDQDGELIEFNDDTKAAICKNIIIRRSISKAFFEAAGGKQAKVGNSKR